MLNAVEVVFEWLAFNKEWLFSGVGVVILAFLLNSLKRLIFLRKSRSPDENRKASVDHNRTAILSSFYAFLFVFWRWLVERTKAVRKYFTDRQVRRNKRLYQQMTESTVFFSHRFADAFPGCRGVVVIDDPAEAVRRLDILLRKPLFVSIEHKNGSFGMDPIWWFRGGQNLPIKTYQKIRKHMVFPTQDILLNGVEMHRVRRVVAFGSMSYWANAVYIETEGVPPSGLYDYGLSDRADERGYDYEEVGVYKGRFIRREEYDDGAALIDGRVLKTLGKAKLQIRYLSPFNFFIVAVGSPMNVSNYDHTFEEALNAILQNRMTIEEIAELLRKLPRNAKEDRMAERALEQLAKLSAV